MLQLYIHNNPVKACTLLPGTFVNTSTTETYLPNSSITYLSSSNNSIEIATSVPEDLSSIIAEYVEERAALYDKYFTSWAGNNFSINSSRGIGGLLTILPHSPAMIYRVGTILMFESIPNTFSQKLEDLNVLQMCLYHYLNNIAHRLLELSYGMVDRFLGAKARWNAYVYSKSTTSSVSATNEGLLITLGYDNDNCATGQHVITCRVSIPVNYVQSAIKDVVLGVDKIVRPSGGGTTYFVRMRRYEIRTNYLDHMDCVPRGVTHNIKDDDAFLSIEHSSITPYRVGNMQRGWDIRLVLNDMPAYASYKEQFAVGLRSSSPIPETENGIIGNEEEATRAASVAAAIDSDVAATIENLSGLNVGVGGTGSSGEVSDSGTNTSIPLDTTDYIPFTITMNPQTSAEYSRVYNIDYTKIVVYKGAEKAIVSTFVENYPSREEQWAYTLD